MSLTRLGGVFAYDTAAPVCSPSSSPRFHHDAANSGDYARDAVAPGRPADPKLAGSLLTITAPGDDLLCGTADHYELRAGNGGWTRSPVTAGAAGTRQALPVPVSAKRVSVRAVDEQGNAGWALTISR